MQFSWKKYTLNFKRPGGTSRGILKTKDSYFILLSDDVEEGIGECGLLLGLSADDRLDYEDKLRWLAENINRPYSQLHEQLREFPSIQAGLEMAFLDLQSKDHRLYPSAFTEGKAMQPINGLIWMGDPGFMKRQVKERLDAGFTVVKMKIGAIDFEEEFAILKMLRHEYSEDEVELRVDANGAFTPRVAPAILERLASLKIHSIEQPIKAGQWSEMADLCEKSPVDIALDEELIGLFGEEQREKMLQAIKPAYIILKPSFVGGFRESEKWIKLAEKHNTGWWVTSALESNVGLNAIAQWNYTQNNPVPSGLGTGSLYTNNFESPLYIKDGCIGYDPERKWDDFGKLEL